MEIFGRASSRERQEKAMQRVVAIATVLVLATVVSVAAGEAVELSRIAASPPSQNVTTICMSTPYPSACERALSSTGSRLGTARDDPFVASVRFATAQAASVYALARNFSVAAASARLRRAAPSGMNDCAELLEITQGQLRDALASGEADAVTTWLSAAMTNQGTCAESLAATVTDPAEREAVRARVSALAQFVGTALALHTNKVRAAGTVPTTPPAPEDEVITTTLPSWVSEHDKKLLQSSPTSIGVRMNAVVALDGSGTHRIIGDAIAAVMEAGRGGSGRKVIYVKAGRYEESVRITNKQKNVMLMGDGKGKTVIVDHKSAADGYCTYTSATVAAMGSGFIAKGLTIVNNAGPRKGQAVALLVGGDLSVVYQCTIQAYQDTLYVHSNRQFYADSDISGTVDFIFGNAAVVIQNSNIRPRRPRPGQKDTVTAQGRTDRNQNTGISIHRCRITGASDLGGTPVYLGRPWQKYSRTVVMKSFLDRSIVPAGWLEWSGEFALSTLYYGEYDNTGPGAGTSKRVTWSGVHPSLSTSDAMRFTVANFILGDLWLDDTGVSYVSGL